MSILTRTLKKIRNDDPVDEGKEADKSLPLSENDSSMVNLSGERDPLDISEISLLDLDIRLDKDLSDYEDQTNVPRYAELELDIDLTYPGNSGLPHIENQVLTINPTRSFSHQIDVDLRNLSMSGFITPDNVSTELSHTFRQLKRPIINNVKGKGATVLDNANMIMVTSSVAAEGKTFSAINMAMSIAMEADSKVLLVDADVSKPSHHDIFGVEMKNGLTDFLMGRVKDLSQIIYKTNIPSLSLMFAGSKTPHAIELFASTAMESLVGELSKRYEDRVIVFDSSPLLLPTEASVLASHMGQVVLIIEAEKTRHDMVKRSAEMLSNRIVLLVLNKMREKNELGAYGPYGKYED